MLADAGVPLIEDEVYADLAFSEPRPAPAKRHDRIGQRDAVLVIYQGSRTGISHRLGGTGALPSAGRAHEVHQQRRQSRSCCRSRSLSSSATAVSTSTCAACAASFHDNLAACTAAIEQSFPAGTGVTRPQGRIPPLGRAASGRGCPRAACAGACEWHRHRAWPDVLGHRPISQLPAFVVRSSVVEGTGACIAAPGRTGDGSRRVRRIEHRAREIPIARMTKGGLGRSALPRMPPRLRRPLYGRPSTLSLGLPYSDRESIIVARSCLPRRKPQFVALRPRGTRALGWAIHCVRTGFDRRSCHLRFPA